MAMYVRLSAYIVVKRTWVDSDNQYYKYPRDHVIVCFALHGGTPINCKPFLTSIYMLHCTDKMEVTGLLFVYEGSDLGSIAVERYPNDTEKCLASSYNSVMSILPPQLSRHSG